MPEWDRTRDDGSVQRARLDLRVEGGPEAPVRFVDHKVTHPLARSSVQAAAREDGAAAKQGERDKHRRYGRWVLPLLSETYGRLGPEALHWWRALAKQVAASDPLLRSRGKWAVSGLLSQWWAETSVALQRANAEALLTSLGKPATGAMPAVEHEDPGLGDQAVTDALLPPGAPEA